VYVDLHGKIICFFGDTDIARSQIGAFVKELALVSEKLLKSLHRAQESEDQLAKVSDVFILDLRAFGIAEEQLSAFWKSTVKSCISECT